MADEPKPHRDRYDVSGNIEAEYVDEAQTVLKNLLGLRQQQELHIAEEEALARAYERLLGEVRVDTPLTNELILYIHATIFGTIYTWAGRYRTVSISKPGIIWPPPMWLAANMADFENQVLHVYPPASLANEQEFCRAVAKIQGEFLVVHPFREGNARTIKLATDLLAAQTGRPLLVYDQSDAGRDAYIFAASQAFRKNYQPMEQVIQGALATALKQ